MGQDRNQVRTQTATKQKPKISSSKDSEHGLCLIIYSKVALSCHMVSGPSPILWGKPKNLGQISSILHKIGLWTSLPAYEKPKFCIAIPLKALLHFFWLGKTWKTSLQWNFISNLSFSHRLWRELISLNTLLPVHGAKLPLTIKLVKVFEKIS